MSEVHTLKRCSSANAMTSSKLIQEALPTVEEAEDTLDTSVMSTDHKTTSITITSNKPFQKLPLNKRKSMDFTPQNCKENDSNAMNISNSVSLMSSGAVRSHTKRMKVESSNTQSLSSTKNNKSLWRQ